MSNKILNQDFLEQKCCVIIPTYNNSKTLAHVINSIQDFTNQIIVVNDGSTDNTKEILKTFDRINVVDYQKNSGKGFALRQGFKKAIELNFQYAITIDSDGQHFAEDLPSFLNELKTNRNAIIIGARNMTQAGVPQRSTFGNKFSNFWFWVETGIKLTDTQSGYRLYPIDQLKKMRFFTNKYEFEIEVLVRAAWRGIKVYGIPIKVFYAPKEERISHFRPYKDFARVSVLNTVLVFGTIFYALPMRLFRRVSSFFK